MGFVTSLFGLSSAGGTQPGNGQAKIPNDATFTQAEQNTKSKENQNQKNLVNEIKLDVGNANHHPTIKKPNHEISEKQELYDYFHEVLKKRKDIANKNKDEVKVELQKIKSGIRDKMIEFKKNVPKDEHTKERKKRLSELGNFLQDLTSHDPRENLDTLVCTLELMLEDDTVPYSDKLHIVLMELNELRSMDLTTKKDKIRKIAAGSSLLKTRDNFDEKNGKLVSTEKGKIDEALNEVIPGLGNFSARRWQLIMRWVDGSAKYLPDDPSMEYVRTLLNLIDSKQRNEQKNNESNRVDDNAFEVQLKKLLSTSWYLYPGPRSLIAK